ncbi:hypothetical protein BIU87_05415 [Streptomyces sp. ZS0098]|nr:hypothetical protein BIU87_05415 [Streptomyces sp. ZS0098]
MRWTEWTNQAWLHDLETGRTCPMELGPGRVFRLALARHHTAFARIHPDGDELVLADGEGSPLPSMDGRCASRRHPLGGRRAPGGGRLTWLRLGCRQPRRSRGDQLAREALRAAEQAVAAHQEGDVRAERARSGVAARATASSSVPNGRTGASEVHLIDAATGHEATRVRLSTPLHHGGHMALCGRNDAADGDPVGR